MSEKQKPAYIYTSGGKVFTCDSDTETLPKIPVGVYEVVTPEDGPTYLEVAAYQRFKRPSKIYGVAEKRAGFLIESWNDYNTSTGVLLNGDPGGGKTVVMALIANKALDAGIPVINIGHGVDLGKASSYLDDSIGKAVILFDEFEKFNHDREMAIMHSFLDGVIQRNFLSIICVNSTGEFPDSLLERPSRVRYRFDYNGVTDEEVSEVCADMGIAGKDYEDVKHLSQFNKRFSYDKLISVIREVKRTGKSVEDTVVTMSLGGMPWFLADAEPQKDVAYKIFFDEDKTDYGSYFINEDVQKAIRYFLDGSRGCTNDIYFKSEYRDFGKKRGISDFDLSIERDSILSVNDKEIVIEGRINQDCEEDSVDNQVESVRLVVDLSTYRA